MRPVPPLQIELPRNHDEAEAQTQQNASRGEQNHHWPNDVKLFLNQKRPEAPGAQRGVGSKIARSKPRAN